MPIRSCLQACALFALLTLWTTRLDAAEVGVPISLQIELLDRVLWYERGYQRDAVLPCAVLIVSRRGDLMSSRSAGQLSALLSRAGKLAGRALTATALEFVSVEQVLAAVQEQGAYLVYLAPGLEGQVDALARGLAGRTVMMVSAAEGDVERGATLGFELTSAKPRLVINLRAARAQKLELSAQLLRIARVLQ